MNKEKYSRLTVVLDRETDVALRHIAMVTDQGLSEVVRDLLAEPVAMISATLHKANAAKTPQDHQAMVDQVEMFVESAYGDYLRQRSSSHG